MLLVSQGHFFRSGSVLSKCLSGVKSSSFHSTGTKSLMCDWRQNVRSGDWRETLSMTGAVGAALGANLCRMQQPVVLNRLITGLGKLEGASVDRKKKVTRLILEHCLLQIGASGLDQARAALVAPLVVSARRRAAVEVFKKLQKSDLDLFVHSNPGELLSVIESGTQAFGSLTSNVLSSVIPLLIELTVMARQMHKIPQISRFTGISLAAYFALTFAYSERRVRYRLFHSTAQRELHGALHQSLSHAETTRLLNGSEQEIDSLKKRSEQVARSHKKVLTSLAKLNAMQQVIVHCASTMAVTATAKSVLTDRAQANDIVTTLHMLQRVAQPLHFLGTIYRQFRGDFAALSALRDKITSSPESVRDAPDAKTLRINRGSVLFQNASFSYPGQNSTPNKKAIDGVNFRIPGGAKVAIVGPSGSGKTTLARLILRAYDVNNGAISICDQDIRQVTLKSLRDRVTIVPQDTILFNDTLRNNILCDRKCSEDDLEDVIHAAQLSQTVQSLPNGLDTVVGDRGSRLSGGERQRVCLARCLLKPASVIILDEATAHQDAQTEKRILQSILELKRDKTVITIAHRLHNIASSDQIFFMKDGRIVESGTHDQLLAHNGHYAKLWAEQTNDPATTKESKASSTLPEGLNHFTSSCCH